MKQRVDIMVDIETLGTEPGSTIFQIAAAAFDITNGDIVSEFDKVADIYCRDDLKIMGDALKFWLNDNRETYFKLQERASGCPHVMIADFWRWLTAFTDQEDADVYLWGNGILFDNLFLKKAFEEEGLDYPISFRNDRDVRTLREMAEMKAGLTGVPFSYEKVGTAHDALDDVRSQINMVVAAFNSLMPNTTSPL